MTDPDQATDPVQPCGHGIFSDGTLLVAFPTEEKAREVVQECERDGHETHKLAVRPVFPVPRPLSERIALLEAELRQLRAAFAAATAQRDDLHATLAELREQL